MNAQDFLNSRAEHHVRFLFKSQLMMLEELKQHHDINFKKLKESVREQDKGLIEMADYLDDEYYQFFRKKILDIGNSVLREYYNELETLVVEFKFK